MIKTVLKIDGMMCGMCESHVNDAIRNSINPKKVTSSHSKGETVIISDVELDTEKLSEIISGMGYRIVSVASEPYEKRGLFSFLKK